MYQELQQLRYQLKYSINLLKSLLVDFGSLRCLTLHTRGNRFIRVNKVTYESTNKFNFFSKIMHIYALISDSPPRGFSKYFLTYKPCPDIHNLGE